MTAPQCCTFRLCPRGADGPSRLGIHGCPHCEAGLSGQPRMDLVCTCAPMTTNDSTHGETQRVHDLKVWPPYYDAIAYGSKPFDARKNDRDYQVGDFLRLREWRVTAMDRLEIAGEYTGRELSRVVTFVLKGPVFGIEDGYCVLGLAIPPSPETEEAKARLELIALMDDAVNRAKGCDCARWPNCVCNNAYVRFKDSFAELLAASRSQEER